MSDGICMCDSREATETFRELYGRAAMERDAYAAELAEFRRMVQTHFDETGEQLREIADLLRDAGTDDP